jgi:hypothetical protein
MLLESYIRCVICKFLVEGRVDDIAHRHSLDVADVRRLGELDPTPQKKYLPWIVKQIADEGEDETDVAEIIGKFHAHQAKLKLRDINQYMSLDQLQKAVVDVVNVKSATEKRRAVKASGGDRIYEDDNITVVFVKDKQTSCRYGKGTQWCISGDNANLFDSYAVENEIFYFIMRRVPNDDNYDKLAVKFTRDDNNSIIDTEVYDAQDDVIDVEEDDVSYGVVDLSDLLRVLERDAVKRPVTLQYRIANGDVTDDELFTHYKNNIANGSVFEHMQFFAFVKDPATRAKIQEVVTNEEFLKFVGDLSEHNLKINIDGVNDWSLVWTQNGKPHRDGDKPALIANDDTGILMKWCKHGELHRTTGPAIVRSNGDKEWWVNNRRHRNPSDGPAVELASGYTEYFVNGVSRSLESLKKRR